MQENAKSIERGGPAVGLPVAVTLVGGATNIQLVTGPVIAVVVFNKSQGQPETGDHGAFEAGITAGLIFDFGSRFSLELAYNHVLVGQLADTLDTEMRTLSLGFAVGFPRK
jgi:hypothetical protein